VTRWTRPHRALIAALAFALFCPRHASAQGYGLYEQSTCMMGRAGAGVAAPCDDGSSMFFNPAGLAAEKTVVVSVGVTGIAPRGTFTNSTTARVSTLNSDTFAAPTVYAAAPVGGGVVIGVGVFAPYGLTTDWPTTSEGRFLSYKSSVKSIYVQPTIAVRLGHAMIGGGVDITHTSLELRRRLDLSSQPITGTPLTFAALGVPRGTDFADVDLTGSGTHVGGHVGVLIDANDRVSVGGRYLFHQQVAFDSATFAATQISTGLALPVPLSAGLPAGTPIDRLVAGSFATGGPLSSQTASTSLPLPDQVVLGVAARPTDRLRLMVDYQYTHWSMFDQIAITTQFAPASVTIENFKDTHGIRLGADYRLAGGMALRAGIDAHNAAAPDESVTPLLPEAARWEAAAGVGVPFSGHVRLDLSYMYVHQQDRNGRTVDNGGVPTVALNNGLFHYYANLFSAGLVVHF
jgi:long-chain fatty acid transport protein